MTFIFALPNGRPRTRRTRWIAALDCFENVNEFESVVIPSSEAELSKLSSHASGVRLPDWYGNPGCRFAQPGANIRQPSGLGFARRMRAREMPGVASLGLRFARRRRARKLARGERAKASHPWRVVCTKTAPRQGCEECELRWCGISVTPDLRPTNKWHATLISVQRGDHTYPGKSV